MVTFASSDNTNKKTLHVCDERYLNEFDAFVNSDIRLPVIYHDKCLDGNGRCIVLKEFDYFLQRVPQQLLSKQEPIALVGDQVVVRYVKKETTSDRMREFNKNGTIKHEIQMKDGKRNGFGCRLLPSGKQVYEKWEDDKLTNIVLCQNFKLNGLMVDFCPNGEKHYSKWKDDQLVEDDATVRARWKKARDNKSK